MTNFADYCLAKERAAAHATLAGYSTVAEEGAGVDLLSIGSAWSRSVFDGDFYRSAGGRTPDLPVVTLVHDAPVIGAADGEQRQGSGVDATALHLIHEGLVRVDADAVLRDIGVVREPHVVASVWHPQLVALRLSRGLPRHPTQVIVTESGQLPFDDCLLFNEPSLQVVVVSATRSVSAITSRVHGRPWIRVLDAGDPLSLRRALLVLRHEGVAVVSALGGRRVTSALLADGLVTDLYLTASDSGAAEQVMGLEEGPPLPQRRVLAKTGRFRQSRVRFEHLVAPGRNHWPGALPSFGR